MVSLAILILSIHIIMFNIIDSMLDEIVNNYGFNYLLRYEG